MKNTNLLISNGVNVEESLTLFGNMETYEETLRDFLDGIDEKISKIKKYKENGDMANYAILVHSLKSDSKYLGFTKLAELAYNHELESKNNNLYYITDHFAELLNECDRMVNLSKQYLGESFVANTPANQPQPKKDKTILVVDDSTIILNFIEKIFNQTLEVINAKDGAEAIAALIRNEDVIIGVLLDLNMPNVNGFEVLEYFKENNLFSKIAVSIITGEDSKEVIEKAFAYPIVDVLTKPFNERDVKRIVEKTIEFNENR